MRSVATTMEYISTRGDTAPMPFMDAVMTGQAPDGGLLVPASIPDVSAALTHWSTLSYTELAGALLGLFAEDIPADDLSGLVARSYAAFDSPEITPLVPLGELRLLELFHGPTLAFKDVALQLLGNLFEYVLQRRGGSLNILGATSGDTGSAGIYGVRGKAGVRIFVMYPDGRTSAVQERQMTTVLDENVHCLAIEGSFDDCQGLMKSIFNDLEFKRRHHLGAINSINCARLLAQVVYYFYAYFRTAERVGEPVSFSVPTGNFGDIFAGYLARKMGLPVHKLILATNENDILRVFFERGVYRRGEVHETLSPSMDIQVASNFERYLYYRLNEDASVLVDFMGQFASTGEARLADFVNGAGAVPVSETFVAHTTPRTETLATIARYHEREGYVLDPHTAVGVAAAEAWKSAHPGEGPVVCLATAHPAKFSEATEEAIGERARHPLVDRLDGAQSRCHRLSAEVSLVQQYIHDACVET